MRTWKLLSMPIFEVVSSLFERKSTKPNRTRSRLEVEVLEARACPATLTWIGPNGGDFANGAFWVGGTGAPPTAADDLVFDGAYSNGDCVFNGPPDAPGVPMANSITMNASYAGTLHLQQPWDAIVGPGGINLGGGDIEQDSGTNIECQGDFNWTGGDLNANSPFLANLDLSAGKAFNVSNNEDDTTGDNINLKGSNGSVSLPGHKITFNKNAGISIDNTSTLNLIDGTFQTTGTGVITNQGTLEKTAGTNPFVTDLAIVNSGLFQLQSGLLQINGKEPTKNSSFNQSGGTCDLWAATTLSAKQGFYMNGGVLQTESSNALGHTSSINDGDILLEGGVIKLNVNNVDGTNVGVLSSNKALTIQGNAEYQAKIDSTNNTADRLSIAGNVTIGGNAKLTALSVNLINGKVKRNNTWDIISSAGTITGDFATKNLAFNDGSGDSYTGALNGTKTKYQLTSPP